MKPRVWIEGNLSAKAQERLARTADVVRSKNAEDIVGVDGAVLGSQIEAGGALIETAGEQLVVMARIGIGVDNVDIDAATARGVMVLNTPDAPTESTAEHTLALMMSLAKRVVRGHLSLTSLHLQRREMFGTELRGLVLGVIGFGRIGRRVAEICGRGLGMKILVYDPYVAPSEIEEPFERAGTVEALLERSDVVTLHLALSEGTRRFIGGRELAIMKPTAYLVNASRGQVVDEEALVEALEGRRIAGAALDVFECEPPPDDHPLLNLDNVVVTPHIASFTEAGVEAMGMGVVEQLEALFRGERPRFVVNPEAWPGRLERWTSRSRQ